MYSLKIFKVFLKQFLQIKIKMNPKVFQITSNKHPLYFQSSNLPQNNSSMQNTPTLERPFPVIWGNLGMNVTPKLENLLFFL